MVSKTSKVIVYVFSLVSIVALFLFALFTQNIIKNLWYQNEIRERDYIKAVMYERVQSIEKELEHIAMFVDTQKHREDFEQELLHYSEHVFENIDGLLNFSIAPEGIQQYVFPIEGNEGILGHNLFEDEREDVQKALEDAMNLGTVQINGPYPMRTNPNISIVVFRYPLYESNEEFYGFVNIVVETDLLFLPAYNEFDSQIYDVNIASENGEIVFGNVDNVLSTEEIITSSFEWVIGYSYKDSYMEEKRQMSSLLDIVFFAGFFIIVSIEVFLVSKTRKLSVKIDDMIYFDSLTKLPNRRLLEHYLANFVGDGYTICFLDIDDFKYINDTFGHEFGDKILNYLAADALDKSALNFYRWGGDEFIIILETTEETEIKEFLEELYKDFTSTIIIDDIPIKISFSIGVLSNKNNAFSIDESVQFADMAMYTAKKSGKNKYMFYDESQSFALKQLFKFDQMTKVMNFEEQADIYFQPRFSFKTGKLEGLEALFRIVEDDQAYLPGRFIEAAENNGIIVEIDKFGLRKVLSRIKTLHEHGIDVPIAVNISGGTIMDGFDEVLKYEIDKNQVSASSIEIEITESASLNQYVDILPILQRVNDLGSTVLMDDFGKEYSGLTNLSNLPIQAIKIDRHFVSMIHKENTFEIVRTVAELGKRMNLKVIAEGVETIEQFETLKELGCDSFQGFLFERPISFSLLLEKYGNKKTSE